MMAMNPGIAMAAQGMGGMPPAGGIATPMPMGQPMGQPAIQPLAQTGGPPQGIASVTAPLMGMKSDQLLPMFAASPNFATLAALTNALEKEKIEELARGQQALEAAKQMQGTVAGEVVKQAVAQNMPRPMPRGIPQGIGSQNYGFAGGGIVALTNGGHLTADNLQGLEDIVASAEAEAEWERQQREMMGGAEPDPDAGSTWDFLRRLSTTGSRARAEKLKQEEEAARQKEAENARRVEEEARRSATALAQPNVTVPPYLAAARPAGAAAARPAGASPAARSVAPAGATPSPAARAAADDPYGFRAASADLISSAQRAGTVSDEERQYRQALMQAMEAERQPTEEYQEPKGLTAKDLLTLAGSMSLEKGEGFGSLARGAAGILEAREGRKREAQKLNREINAANRRLNTAVAQQRLAYATGDRQAKEAADMAVAQARFELRKLEVATGLESRKVGAAEMAAQQRGSTTDETANLRRAQAMRADPQYGGIQKEFEEATRMAGLAPQSASAQARLARARAAVEALAAAYGVVTLPATSGASATAPGASRVIDFTSIK